MSDNLRGAAQAALETLEDVFGKDKIDVSAINNLRAALAEPVVKESLTTQLAALTVRLETAELDAGRYRRLRAWRYELSAGLNFPDSETKWIDENDLDAAIDAAMKECGK